MLVVLLWRPTAAAGVGRSLLTAGEGVLGGGEVVGTFALDVLVYVLLEGSVFLLGVSRGFVCTFLRVGGVGMVWDTFEGGGTVAIWLRGL